MLISIAGWGQKKDSTISLYGNLYDTDQYHPVKYAHIINMNGNNATISDSLGTFNLEIERGDSLMITSIGYKTQYYQYTGKLQPVIFKSIPMEKTVYAISEVEITPWGKTYEDFQRNFLELDLKTAAEQVHPLFWQDIRREPEVEETLNPGITSPISMIYSIFNDELQSRRKLKQLQQQKTRQDKIDDKFNREQISELTGLTGEKLERFMDYCNFSDEYILKTREYFILERVKRCYKRFRRIDSLRATPSRIQPGD